MPFCAGKPGLPVTEEYLCKNYNSLIQQALLGPTEPPKGLRKGEGGGVPIGTDLSHA